MDCRMAQAPRRRASVAMGSCPPVCKLGAATGASAAVGLLYWSVHGLYAVQKGLWRCLILIFVPSTFTLIIDDGEKLRVDLHRAIAGWAIYKGITVIPEARLRALERWCNGDASQRADGRAQPSALRTNLPSTRDADDAPPPPPTSYNKSLRHANKEDALRLLEQVVSRTARRSCIRRAAVDSEATGRRPAPRVFWKVRRGAQLRGRRRR